MNEIHFQFPLNLCAISASFFEEASKRGLKSFKCQYLWNSLNEILSMPQNLLARKKIFLPVEKAEIAPEVLRNGFSVIPVQNEDLRLMMEIMQLPTTPGGKRSVLISRGHCDFPELLGFLKAVGILVSVISIDEPMPAGYERLVENWINVLSSEEDTQKPEEPAEAARTEPQEEEGKAEVLPEAKESEEVGKTEEVCETGETKVEEETREKLPSSAEVVSLLNFGSGSSSSNVIPKRKKKVPLHVTSAPKYEVLVQEKANRIVQKLEIAIEECALQKMHLEDPASAESPAKFPMIAAQTDLHTLDLMAEIFSQLKIAYDWFGHVLSENPIDKKLERPIVLCGNNALRLLGMYYGLMGGQGDSIYNSCFGFFQTEVVTPHNRNAFDWRSRKNDPTPVSEIGSIQKSLEELVRIYEDRIAERQLTGRLKANVQSLKRNPENRSEIFSCIMDDIRQLFTYFNYRPESDFIYQLFSQHLEYFPEESEFSDEFYRIRSEIEYRKTAEELANCSPSELENRYHSNVDVLTVRKSFEGKTLVVIGGIPKPTQKANFEKAFGCEVEWRETSHGESLDFYVPYLSNPDVCAFMVLIQLASHKHSEELGALASQKKKQFFRVHTTNPIAAAKEIVSQYLEG